MQYSIIFLAALAAANPMANSGNKQQGYGSNAPSYGDEQQSPPGYNAGPSTTTSSWSKSSSVKPTTTSTWVHTSTVTSSTHVTLSTGYSSSTTKGAKPKSSSSISSSSSTGPAKYHTTLETSSKSSIHPTSSKGPKSQSSSSSSTSSTGPTKYHTTLSTSSKSSTQPTPTKGMSGGTSSSTKNNGKSDSNDGSSGKSNSNSNSSTNGSQVCPSTAFPQCCQLNVLGLAGVSCSNGKKKSLSCFLLFIFSLPTFSSHHHPYKPPAIFLLLDTNLFKKKIYSTIRRNLDQAIQGNVC